MFNRNVLHLGIENQTLLRLRNSLLRSQPMFSGRWFAFEVLGKNPAAVYMTDPVRSLFVVLLCRCSGKRTLSYYRGLAIAVRTCIAIERGCR